MGAPPFELLEEELAEPEEPEPPEPEPEPEPEEEVVEEA